MKITAVLCPLLKKRNIAKDVFDIWVLFPQAAAIAKPGQFAHIRCGGENSAFTLRRPVSICEIDRGRGALRFVFEIRGGGTRWMAGIRPGECLDVLAPLGNGFPFSPDGSAVFVGGGIGVPPLLEASKAYGKKAEAFLGFRSAENVILREDFERYGVKATLATQDGTAGERGLITVPLIRRLDTAPCGAIYACGPIPMLKAVAAQTQKRNIPCFVSMEERMACGVGACLGCAVRIRLGGGEQYLHVCKNGPVFDARTVVW